MITGIVGGAFFLFIIYLGGLSFTILITLLALIAYFELLRMAKMETLSSASCLGLLFLVVKLLPYFTSWKINMELISLSFVLMLLFIMVLTKNRFTFEQAGALLLGTIYISYGFSYFIEVRLNEGLSILMFILLLIWATDSGAYFVGSKVGKHKLWPAISPKKSIEGAIGGIMCAVFVAIIFQGFVGVWESWGLTIGLAVIISIMGQLGDLAESALKRHYQVKDSGRLLPGHGGVLDRFDSILFVFPILHILQLI